jgi:hypothetical protein
MVGLIPLSRENFRVMQRLHAAATAPTANEIIRHGTRARGGQDESSTREPHTDLRAVGIASAGAAVPGFAGNVTGGGNATPVVVEWATTATFPIALPYTYTTYAPEVSRCIALNAAGSGKGLREAVNVLSMCGGSTSHVYQAENGTVGGGTVFESSNAGFNGTGYVNSSASGGFAQINNVDGRGGGAKTLRIRFALGASAARTGRLVVNGVGTNITFNSTGAWTTWATQDVAVTLNNNASNTLRFESNGQDLANIDQVEIP